MAAQVAAAVAEWAAAADWRTARPAASHAATSHAASRRSPGSSLPHSASSTPTRRPLSGNYTTPPREATAAAVALELFAEEQPASPLAQVSPWLTAAAPMENLCCSCKLTPQQMQARLAEQELVHAASLHGVAAADARDPRGVLVRSVGR